MARTTSATTFTAAFLAAVRQLREQRGLTQFQVAAALGLAVDVYRKYELRSPLPHRFIVPFCTIAGVTPDDLYELVAQQTSGPRAKKRDAA